MSGVAGVAAGAAPQNTSVMSHLFSVIGSRLYDACPTPSQTIVGTARVYAGTIDSVGALANVSYECAKAAYTGAYEVSQQGLTGTLTEGAKAAFGVNELTAAKETLFRDKKLEQVANGQLEDGTPIFVAQEKFRPLSERFGAAAFHVGNAGARAGATVLVGGGYVMGTTLNLISGAPEICTVDTIHESAQVIATGVNTALQVSAKAAWNYGAPVTTTAAKLGWYGLSSAFSFVANHPLAVGSIGFAYAAAKETINCAESTGKVEQVAHGAIAAACAIGAVAFPFVASTL